MQSNFLTSFSKMQEFWWQNYMASVNMEDRDDPRLVQSLYQTKYAQNYEALKNEFKVALGQNISFVALKKYFLSPCETKR